MRLRVPTDQDPYYYLDITENIFIHTINDWEQLFGRWNWYTFHILQVYFEKDDMCGGYEFQFAILGLGFRLRINDPESEGMKKIKKSIDDIESGKTKLIPFDKVKEELEDEMEKKGERI